MEERLATRRENTSGWRKGLGCRERSQVWLVGEGSERKLRIESHRRGDKGQAGQGITYTERKWGV